MSDCAVDTKLCVSLHAHAHLDAFLRHARACKHHHTLRCGILEPGDSELACRRKRDMSGYRCGLWLGRGVAGEMLEEFLRCDASRRVERAVSDVCTVVGIVDGEEMGTGIEVSEAEG